MDADQTMMQRLQQFLRSSSTSTDAEHSIPTQLRQEHHAVSATPFVPSTTLPQAVQARTTPRDRMLGTPGRSTHMNTPAIAGGCPMSSVIYGFRPESGWGGVMFQMVLQGPFIEAWKERKDMEYWICFDGNDVKAVLFDLVSTTSLPDLGTKRYVLQCLVPNIGIEAGRVPVTLRVNGAGGKTVNSGLCVGMFDYKPSDGTLISYEYNGNFIGLMAWMELHPPMDLDHPSPINAAEVFHPHNGQDGQTVIVAIPLDEMPALQSPYSQPEPDFDTSFQPPAFDSSIGTPHFDFSQLSASTPEQAQYSFMSMTQDLSLGDGEMNDYTMYPQVSRGISTEALASAEMDDYTMYPQVSRGISAEALASAGVPGHYIDPGQMTQQDVDLLWATPMQSYATLDQAYQTASHSGDAIQVNLSHFENPIHQQEPAPQQTAPQQIVPQEPAPQEHPPQKSTLSRLIFLSKPETLGDYTLWTPEERNDKRSIIAFVRQTRGDLNYLTCHAVPANAYNQGMDTVSCVYWAPNPQGELQHKLAGRCIFTSVDIIGLLEKLAAHSFTVQEKNRIRRNLEAYKPETVKKNGTTNQFFDQLMGYKSPRTRNIEKDIKVFLWDDLSKALRKIVTKYQVDEGGVAIGERIADAGPF